MSWLSIALIVFIALYLRERHQNKQLSRQNEDLRRRLGAGESIAATEPARDDGLDTQELDELRERIHVLERIATNENSSEARKAQRIAAEIESLRGDIASRADIGHADNDGQDRNTEELDR